MRNIGNGRGRTEDEEGNIGMRKEMGKRRGEKNIDQIEEKRRMGGNERMRERENR